MEQKILTRRKVGAVVSTLVSGLIAFSMIQPVANAQTNVCSSYTNDRCYAKVNSMTAVDIYQGTANQAWVCQSIPAPVQDFALQTMWAATGNSSWVEFGIVTGLMHPSAGQTSASREWYAARASTSGGWYGENMISAPKPNRDTFYVTSIRYDGADWYLFHGSHAVLKYEGPDDGRIRYLQTGGETTNSVSALSGKATALKHQRWGESTTRNGWPGLTTSTTTVNPPLSGSWINSQWVYTNPGATMVCN